MKPIICFILLSILFSCNSPNKKIKIPNKKLLFVYHIVYGEKMFETVTGFALKNDTVYYMSNDSLLMTYKSLPSNTKILNDTSLKKLLSSLKIKDMKEIIDYSNSGCESITMNEYVIRITENEESKEFLFTEVLDCKYSSQFKFIENLHYFFKKYK